MVAGMWVGGVRLVGGIGGWWEWWGVGVMGVVGMVGVVGVGWMVGVGVEMASWSVLVYLLASGSLWTTCSPETIVCTYSCCTVLR